jgi:hypothetical protein
MCNAPMTALPDWTRRNPAAPHYRIGRTTLLDWTQMHPAAPLRGAASHNPYLVRVGGGSN